MPTRPVTRTRAVGVALLAAFAVSAAAAGPAPAAVQPPPTTPRAGVPAGSAGARMAVCRRSPLIDERVAVLGAWMKPLAGAPRLALRIELLQRTLPVGRWTRRTDVPGLGAWTTPSDPLLGSSPGDVFKYRQAVGGLVVPAAYRFRVTFRWSDAAGAVVSESAVTTSVCRQPDQRPDLVLDEVRTSRVPGKDALVRYVVVVRNAGRTAASRAVVAATLPGDPAPRAHVRSAGRLEPGSRALVAFTGPGCATGEAPALFAADPANVVDEADEADNELPARCPAP